jgi:hypothetical protein
LVNERNIDGRRASLLENSFMEREVLCFLFSVLSICTLFLSCSLFHLDRLLCACPKLSVTEGTMLDRLLFRRIMLRRRERWRRCIQRMVFGSPVTRSGKAAWLLDEPELWP